MTISIARKVWPGHAFFMIRMSLLAILLVACGSDAQKGPCAKRSGVYTTTYQERANGTCGALPTAQASVTEQPAAGPVAGTLGPGISYSSDNCTVTSDVRTPDEKQRMESTFTWDESASRGTGVVRVTRFGDAVASGVRAVICASTYDATSVRQ